MPAVLVDTGVWYALCDPTDGAASRDEIIDLADRIEPHRIIVPWPIAYETLRSSFVRKRLALQRFKIEMSSPRVVFLDDSPYRDVARDLSFRSSLQDKRPLSMVDCMMRLLLDDTNVSVQYLATFNARDFADVCTRRRIELWSR